MFNRETISDRIQEMQRDFEFQLKRSKTCIENCDAEGSQRWLNEAVLTGELIKNLQRI
jgi:hypothetical protein